jgi:serine phosphatase RsbU (regulator of sigma subunit)
MRAGHPGVLLRQGGAVKLHECAHGPALGIVPGLSDWPVAQVPMEPGSELLFYTDGLYENRAEDGLLWGIERMIDNANELAHLTDRQFVDALIASTRDRTGRGDCDDVAVLHLRVKE